MVTHRPRGRAKGGTVRLLLTKNQPGVPPLTHVSEGRVSPKHSSQPPDGYWPARWFYGPRHPLRPSPRPQDSTMRRARDTAPPPRGLLLVGRQDAPSLSSAGRALRWPQVGIIISTYNHPLLSKDLFLHGEGLSISHHACSRLIADFKL
ncbi:unnamed protein product [Spodoptera exigua]|nr:unnamed protein product [Spodoptera exigua]